MQILIVEDERHAAALLERMLREVMSARPVEIRWADSVSSAAEYLERHAAPDLLLLDIELGDGVSFELFERVRITSPVVFITAYDQYAVQAFKVNSLDFLLKPVGKADLERMLQRYSHRQPSPAAVPGFLDSVQAVSNQLMPAYKTRFLVRIGERLRFIKISEVLFFYSRDKATYAYSTEQRSYPLDLTLDQLQQKTDPARFFRISRQYLVNLDSIREVIPYSGSRWKLSIADAPGWKEDIIVSRERVQGFRIWLEGH